MSSLLALQYDSILPLSRKLLWLLPFSFTAALAAKKLVLWYLAKPLPLPPGPPGKAIIGNLHDIPELLPWQKYREWTERYGMLHGHVIIGPLLIFWLS